MKKLLVLLLSVIMVIGFAQTALADDGIPSVTTNGDVKVSEGGVDLSDVKEGTEVVYDGNTITYTANDDCEVRIVLTPYASYGSIESEESQAEIKEAYANIKNENELLPLAATATNNNVSDLTVSNLFDVTVYSDGQNHEGDHNKIYNLEVGSDTVSRFVALAHYNEDGSWSIVEDAKASGKNITFSYSNCSPFAVIVKKASGGNAVVDTGVTTTVNYLPYVVGAFVVGAACIILVMKKRNAK